MSYDIDLLDPVTKDVIHFANPHQIQGGTYAVGGTTEASLNITYNYGKHYYKHIHTEEGIRHIYGKTGAESTPILEAACLQLSDETDSDYWKATEGNAKQALRGLLVFAYLRPDGIWEGD